MFPGFERLLDQQILGEALEAAARSEGQVQHVIGRLPSDWEVSADAAVSVREFLSARAEFLLRYLPARLVELSRRNGELPFEDGP